MKKNTEKSVWDTYFPNKLLMIMRLSTILLIFGLLNLHAKGFSQNEKISLHHQGISMKQLLENLEQLSEYKFLYSDDFDALESKLNINVEKRTVSEILNEVAAVTESTYKILDNKLIVIVPKNLLPAQQFKFGGSITDATTGEPIIGANVIVEGTTMGVVTDVNGKFSLEVPNPDAFVVISYLGYKTERVAINKQAYLEIKLIQDITRLDEVIVVGYGTQKKSDIISSVASVRPEKMTKSATLDVGEMLRGKVAGVQITTSDAGPGGSSSIEVRGKSSITGGNSPIVIADGVPIGSINDINPADIESVEVLKDAAAQAIYGAKASNGVILITTKRGKTGKLSVNYNGYYGTQTVKRNFDVYDGVGFAQLKREADRAVNKNIYRDDALVFSAAELQAIAEGRSIDWTDEILKSAPIQNHDINFSAGTEKTMIYVGGNYQNMDGIVPTTNLKKGTLRINLDQILTKWLKVGVNASFQASKANDPDVAGVLRQVITASPLGNIYNEDGTYNVRPSGNQESFNPLLDLNETENIKKNRNDILNIFVDITPVKGLTNRINASRRSWNYKETYYASKKSSNGYANGYGNGNIAFKENAEWLVENILSYNLSVQKHNINLTAVGSISQQDYSDFYNSTSKVPNDILGIYGLESALINIPTIGGNQRRLVSGVGRIQYDYNSRYYATISARMDGSSVFGAENKWGYFPAVALGWNVYKENFLANFRPLSNLKLRASYGSVGNEAIAPYGSLSLADQLDYLYGADKISGYAPGSSLSNPKLRWETSTTLNTAVDFGFFDNRLSGTVEYYKTSTTDLLVNRQLNASIGYSTMKDNIGEVQNRGIEIQLDAVPIRTKDLNIQTGIIFSKNTNEIISLYGDLDGDGNQDSDVANNWFIGQPIDVYKMPKYLGVWQAEEVYPGSTFNATSGKWEINGVQAPVAIDPATNLPLVDPFTKKAPIPGSCKIEDKNNDGKIDSEDNYLTSKYPDWMASFNVTATFKGFDFSMDISTVQGITRNNVYLYDYTYGGDLRGNRNGIKVDYWTPENPASMYPQPNAGTSPPGMPNLGLQDASYWRLQNVSLGYSFPSSVLSKIKLTKLRIYCTGQNLVTVTDYQSYSPEQDLSAYPTTRNLIFGLQVGL